MIRVSLTALAVLVLCPSLGTAKPNFKSGTEYAGLIQKCVAALKDNKSTSILNNKLVREKSYILVVDDSVTDGNSIFFKQPPDVSLEADPSIIDHQPATVCLITDALKIIQLSSSEIDGNETVFKHFIPIDESYEEQVYDRIVTSVRSGCDVYIHEIFFEMKDGKVKLVGESETRKLEPQDFANEQKIR